MAGERAPRTRTRATRRRRREEYPGLEKDRSARATINSGAGPKTRRRSLSAHPTLTERSFGYWALTLLGAYSTGRLLGPGHFHQHAFERLVRLPGEVSIQFT